MSYGVKRVGSDAEKFPWATVSLDTGQEVERWTDFTVADHAADTLNMREAGYGPSGIDEYDEIEEALDHRSDT